MLLSNSGNIKKISDFMKREGKNLKEILNMITEEEMDGEIYGEL